MTIADPMSKLVTVFGGSGFVGRHVVRALARRGYRVRVAVRRPDLAGHVQPLGGVGQIKPIQANVRFRWSVDRAVHGADAVVNLVGVLYNAGPQTFDSVQSFGARAVAESCRAAGIGRLVQMSAIGADAGSDIAYLRSKGEGERAALENVSDAVITRPSIVFGPEDGFFNRFASMARFAPVLPLFGGGGTLFQPVYVGDVAEAIARAVDGDARPGAAYELGGPEALTFRQCMEAMLAVTNRRRPLVSVPFRLAKTMGRILGALPKPLLTYDQVRMLELPNVVTDEAKAEGRTLEGLGIDPMALEIILPTYLVHYRAQGQFTRIGAL